MLVSGGIIYTSSVGPHSRGTGEIVLCKSLTFNDLLGDYIPSPEQNLGSDSIFVSLAQTEI